MPSALAITTTMQAKQKTYRNLVCPTFSTHIEMDGKRVDLSFKSGGREHPKRVNGTLRVTNPELMEALEQHANYGKKWVLVACDPDEILQDEVKRLGKKPKVESRKLASKKETLVAVPVNSVLRDLVKNYYPKSTDENYEDNAVSLIEDFGEKVSGFELHILDLEEKLQEVVINPEITEAEEELVVENPEEDITPPLQQETEPLPAKPVEELEEAIVIPEVPVKVLEPKTVAEMRKYLNKEKGIPWSRLQNREEAMAEARLLNLEFVNVN